MTASELSEVLNALGRLEARLDRLERAVQDAPRRERISLEKLVDGMLAEARARAEAARDEAAPDELAERRQIRKPHKR